MQLQEESNSALEKEMQDLSVRHPEVTVKWEKFCWTVLPEYDKKKKTLLVRSRIEIRTIDFQALVDIL